MCRPALALGGSSIQYMAHLHYERVWSGRSNPPVKEQHASNVPGLIHKQRVVVAVLLKASHTVGADARAPLLCPGPCCDAASNKCAAPLTKHNGARDIETDRGGCNEHE